MPNMNKKSAPNINMDKTVQADIADLKHTLVQLRDRLKTMDDNVKMTMFDQRKLRVDLDLRGDEIKELLDRRLKSGLYDLSDKHQQNVKRFTDEQAALEAKMAEIFATVNDNLIQKPQVHAWITEEVAKECKAQRQQLEKAVMATIKESIAKVQVELQKTLYDEVVGNCAIKAMEMEVKLTDRMNARTKKHKQQLENLVAQTLEREVKAHREKVDGFVAAKLADDVSKVRENLSKHFTKAQQAKMEVHKKELADLMKEEVNDVLDQHKDMLDRRLTNELQEKIQVQEDQMLKVITKGIADTSKKSKTEVLQTLWQQLQQACQQQEAKLKEDIDAFLDKSMAEQKEELDKILTGKMMSQVETSTQELHTLLSEEFDGEMALMQTHIEEQEKMCIETQQEVYELDSKYHAKVPFLLERYSTEFTWQLDAFSQVVENLRNQTISEFQSEVFLTVGDQLEMQAKILLHGKDLYVKVSFLKANQDPEIARHPNYHHRRTVMLLNQSEQRKNRIRIQEPGFGTQDTERMALGTYGGARVFRPLDGPPHQNDAFVQNDTAFVRIVIEPLHILYKSYASTNGILFWKVENFSQMKQEERDGLTECLYSDYFYSGFNGYRLQMALYLSSTHLTFFLRFLKGEWDSFLPPIFPHKTTLMILDQTDSTSKEHLSKSLSSTSTNIDMLSKFALHSQVRNPMYCKDDTLLVKVLVEPTAEEINGLASEDVD